MIWVRQVELSLLMDRKLTLRDLVGEVESQSHRQS